MKQKIKKGLIALLSVCAIECVSACALFAVPNSNTQSSMLTENSSEMLSTDKESSDFTSQEEKADGESNTSNSSLGESVGEGDSSESIEGENSTVDESSSSGGKIELPEDKFH